MSAYTGIAILFLIVFLVGIMFGIFVIVSWSSNREDKKKSLKGPPPGNGCGGTRKLVGVGRRDTRRNPPAWRPGQQSGHGWGVDR
ncbi:MAG TPA: hypothetical protein VHZ03_48310 [Trebonia sp.]|jgi:hypothetical protein|nr:hypothetical protein [Trebonia sp.]